MELEATKPWYFWCALVLMFGSSAVLSHSAVHVIAEEMGKHRDLGAFLLANS